MAKFVNGPTNNLEEQGYLTLGSIELTHSRWSK